MTDHPERTLGLRLRPMVHVKDMASSVAFYESLGANVVHGSRDGDWVLLRLAGSQITAPLAIFISSDGCGLWELRTWCSTA